MSTALRDRLGERILRPEDPGYDEARAIHNGLVDKRPALIVRCRSADDVVAALALARDDAGSRSRSAAAVTTSPGARSPTAA